jgi:hypothetical protein
VEGHERRSWIVELCPAMVHRPAVIRNLAANAARWNGPRKSDAAGTRLSGPRSRHRHTFRNGGERRRNSTAVAV